MDLPRKSCEHRLHYPLAKFQIALIPLFDRSFDPRTWKVKIPLPQLKLCLESLILSRTRRLTSPWFFVVFGAAYIISVSFLSRASSFQTPSDAWLGCTSTFWLKDDGCGLNGQSCSPFDNVTYDFRCPAQCSSVVLQNPRVVGIESVDFVPLLVGGGDDQATYRGDSFICAAAIQSGLVSNSRGGCASLRLVGNFTDYRPRSGHGLTSIGFPTIFPSSFRFLPSTPLHHCSDLRNEALALNVLVTCIIFLVLRPRPIVLFWSLVCIGFWHITLFSQPRSLPPDISDGIGTFLPVLFIAYAFWRVAWRFVLPAFSNAPFERMIWYLGPFWVGVLTNLTTDKIPIDRLTASDINQQAGGVTSLVIICVVLLFIVINQVRVIRKTGWLPWYAMWYAIGGLVVMVFALLPTLNLRIHHYILAIVLMPGTAFPTRLSAIYQGLLLGMFLNGAAAFDLASMFQTAAELQRDAISGSALPTFLTNSTTYNASIPLHQQIISWAPPDGDWDGFNLLVDDVERYSGAALNYSLAALQEGIPHFFRLAFTSQGSDGDFTMAATLWPNGTWVDPPPGGS
ncbi:hypothetical protein PUNSTDRAFT_59668 [Punctularia strigosozonata HHB-11173 SS5]|uniref:uncharacterized protein n=1 Tax=Punctularia strigosozonata (strain HHB-11173) TaxID=741275 RepID=UPI0004417BEB|nr:uncharacterized protein PUNSTDRAFT_59668 [Punctularia strigosozonata HHB-11173 SS5]EIN14083.1 hypothetical protein PUNSTDRAFT_59668 [Punctularia strigosozonata HHB-11173 SS5]